MCLRKVHTLGGVCRRRSPPRRPSDIRCHRRVPVTGGYPWQRADRPRSSFRRRPAKSAAFRKTGMPSTVTTREGICRGRIAPSGLRASSLAHAAHTSSPERGQCLRWALQGHGAVTRGSVTTREYRRLFDSLELPRLGLTTQARHRARPARPSTRTDCLARTGAGRSA